MKKYLNLLGLIFLLIGCINNQNEKGNALMPTSIVQPTSEPTLATAPAFFIGDGGILSKKPCGPPCFFGIEAGRTSQDEVPQILLDKEIMDQCSTIDHYQFAIDEGIGGWACQSIATITYRKATGVVDSIGFELERPVTLHDIVAEYGYPDIIIIKDVGLPESPTLLASIYYSSLKFVLPIKEQQYGITYFVEPATFIQSVIYLDEESIKNDLEMFSQEAFSWKGYGHYP